LTDPPVGGVVLTKITPEDEYEYVIPDRNNLLPPISKPCSKSSYIRSRFSSCGLYTNGPGSTSPKMRLQICGWYFRDIFPQARANAAPRQNLCPLGNQLGDMLYVNRATRVEWGYRRPCKQLPATAFLKGQSFRT